MDTSKHSNPVGFTATFQAEPTLDSVRSLSGWTLLEFGAAWCGVCRATQPYLMNAMVEYPKLRHLKLADGKGLPLGRAFRVKLWPTLVLLHDGVEVARKVRPANREQVSALLGEMRRVIAS